MMTLTMMAPFLLIAAAVVILLIWLFVRRRRRDPALTVPQKEKPGRKAAAFLPGFLLCVGHMGSQSGVMFT